MNKRIGLNITKTDIIFSITTFVLSLVLACFIFFLPQDNTMAKVCVFYDQELLCKVDLIPENGDKSARHIVLFKNEKTAEYDNDYNIVYSFDNLELLIDDLIVEIKDAEVSIIKETSPQNICSEQGAITNAMTPLICAPNYVKVIITTSDIDSSGDTEL